jgi:heterodisulfide reductase subunit A
VGDGYVVLNPLIAEVNPELCRACGRCEKECEFHAIGVDEKKLLAEVEEIMCEGCGKCAVVCPTGALSVKSFKEGQLLAAIDGLMEGVGGKEAEEMVEITSKS